MKRGKTGFCLWYEKTIGKIIPKYGFFSVIFCFVFNSLIYTGLQILMKEARHFDLTLPLDRAIPFQPGWSFVYLGCFLFWAVNYILITRQGKEGWYQFAVGDYLSRIVCGIFFILLPTTNIRPEVSGDGLPEILMQFIYWIDAPTNLFPSIHCLVSWLCGGQGEELYTEMVSGIFLCFCHCGLCFDTVYQTAFCCRRYCRGYFCGNLLLCWASYKILPVGLENI